MIKKSFKSFKSIKESINDLDDQLDELLDISLDFSGGSFTRSFNSLTESSSEFKSELESVGYPMSRLKQLYGKNPEKFLDKFCDLNAEWDAVLYELSNKKHPLSGNYYDEDYGEPLIKYSYGYHRSLFGLLYLQQYYGLNLKMEDVKLQFLTDMSEKFISYLSASESGSNVSSSLDSLNLDESELIDMVLDSANIEHSSYGDFVKVTINKKDLASVFKSKLRKIKDLEDYDEWKSNFESYFQEFIDELIADASDYNFFKGGNDKEIILLFK